MNFDISNWVEMAWSRPPAKSDILFRSMTSSEGDDFIPDTNARIRKADDYAYSEGYRLAARIVVEHVIQNSMEADFLVYPIVFLYRHNVELQLKRLIPIGALLVNRAISKADCKLLQKSHHLDELWALFEPILRTTVSGSFGIKSSDIDGIGSYIRQLHEIDRGSYSARYALTPDGQPSIDNVRHPALNIGVIAECMERLTGYLFGLAEAFHEAQQFKCEMEDEDRAEEMEYYEGEDE
jgi:hypothetical protein